MSAIITHPAGFTLIRNDHNIDLPMFYSTHDKAVDAWFNAPQRVKDGFERVKRNGYIPAYVSYYFAQSFDVDIFQAQDMNAAYNPMRYTFAAVAALGGFSK